MENQHPQSKRKIILTEDGSSSLFVETLNEHYHSIHGAVQESMHIFIQAGLLCEQLKDLQTVNILEIGLGSGLNALLTYFSALNANKKVRYTAIEKYPLSFHEVQLLNYPHFMAHTSAENVFRQIHTSEWGTTEAFSAHFSLCKHQQSATETAYPADTFNLVYFDAFSPDVQPELWSEELFKKIYQSMKPESVLLTYSTKGTVKRALKNADFQIEKLPGPKGKREILRAKKQTGE
ncbi:MAG: tRNA (5-methylaminomethyl-2-thiouridine)(34)-methyltransferase MnmD [Bacteroidales bacterium]|nr:tRNA (5-methylaminomethyl-2-thiouridine)(34)-methyltransferase MnmD [Bacteroidales bacterium]